MAAHLAFPFHFGSVSVSALCPDWRFVEHWALGRLCWWWASLWGHEWSETADWDPCHHCKIRKLYPGMEHVCIFQDRDAFSFIVSPSLSRVNTTHPLLRDPTGKISWSSQAGSSLCLGSSALSYFGGAVATVSISVSAWVWLLERKEEGGNGLGSWEHSL